MPQPPQDIQRGDPIRADWLNQAKNAPPANIRGGVGILVKRVGRDLIIENTLRRGALAQVSPFACFRVQSVQDDYLTCIAYSPLDDEDIGEAVAVAKPYELRRTPFDGQTITYADGTALSYEYDSERERTATNEADDSTEAQVVVPGYITSAPTGQDGGLIYAFRTQTGLTDGDGEPITWQDMNIGARGWVKQAE